MIEGLKVTIKGTELQDLCAARAAYHQERAEVYATQLTNMEAAQIEGMQYSGGDPAKALKDKQMQHISEAGELDFIATHLVSTEDYLLGKEDLYKLGIAKRGY